jgi:hypothetical protein
MEEYEIRQLYGRKLKSKLILGGWALTKINDDDDDTRMRFKFESFVVNDGDIMEKDYKINVYFNNLNKHINISWPQNAMHIDYTWLENGRVKVSATGQTPVYPNETVNAMRFDIDIPQEYLIEALGDIKIEISLFYENGEDKTHGDFTGMIDKLTNAISKQSEDL